MSDHDTLPAHCQLDRNRLVNIEKQLETLITEVRALKEFDGPLGIAFTRIGALEQRADTIQEELQEVSDDVNKLQGTVWGLLLKLAGAGVLSGGTVYGVLQLFGAG